MITFGIWIVILIAQHFSSEQTKRLKLKESGCNDTRQKLVSDMINGARTIKCYGWENHYLRKIREARMSQVFYVFWQSIIGSLGLSIFQNGGLLATVAIFIPKWYRGEQLDEGVSMALMAMIFFIFAAVNGMTYYAMTTI